MRLIRNFIRFFGEAFSSMCKNPLMTIASMIIVTSCLLIFGVFTILTINANYLGALQIYNLMISKAIKPQELCYFRFLRGKMLQKLLLHDEALENYKRFNYDFSQLSDKEKSINVFNEIDLHEVHSKNIFG